jgi:WD domain, G-beta repeat
MAMSRPPKAHPDGMEIAPACDMTIEPAHTGPIVRVVVLEGDEHVVTASFDKTLRVHSLVDGRCIQVLRGHKGDVHDVAACGPGLVASASDDKSLRVWNAVAGTCDIVLKCKSSVFAVASIDSDRIVSGCYDGTMDIWSRSAKRRFLTLSPKHSGAVRRISVHGGRYASASSDRTTRIWDSQSYQCIATLLGHKDGVLSVAMCDAFIATGSKDKDIRVYSQVNFTCLRVIQSQHFGICGVVFCESIKPGEPGEPDTRMDLIASASLDDGARLDDAATGLSVWHASKSATDITVFAGGRVLAAGWSHSEKPELLVWPTPRILAVSAEITAARASATAADAAAATVPGEMIDVMSHVDDVPADEASITPDVGGSQSPNAITATVSKTRPSSAMAASHICTSALKRRDHQTDKEVMIDVDVKDATCDNSGYGGGGMNGIDAAETSTVTPKTPSTAAIKTEHEQKGLRTEEADISAETIVDEVPVTNTAVTSGDAIRAKIVSTNNGKSQIAPSKTTSEGVFASYELSGINGDAIRHMKQRQLAGSLAAFFVDYDEDREREWESLQRSFQRVFKNEGLSGGILVGAKALSAKKFQECVRKNWNDEEDEAWKTGYSVQMDRFVLAVQGFMNMDHDSE